MLHFASHHYYPLVEMYLFQHDMSLTYEHLLFSEFHVNMLILFKRLLTKE
jgi:hypothetical protein